MNTNQFTYANILKLVDDGKIFTVDFIKRTTGEPRTMNCRIGVTKHLAGGQSAYSAKAKGLLAVFDMNAKGYRSIPLEAITRLCVGGQTFTVGV